MKTKFLFLVPLLALTACAGPIRSTHNPEGLRDQDLVIVQQEKIAIMQRDAERREMQMRMDHMKELQMLQMQKASRNAECKFFCF